MKRTLILLSLLALIAAIGLGFYMGWFEFSTDNQNNKSNISLSVDRNKLESDKDKVVEAVQDFGQQAKDKVAGTTPATDDQPVVSEQPQLTSENHP